MATLNWWIWVLLALVLILSFKFARKALKLALFLILLAVLSVGTYVAVPTVLSNPKITGLVPGLVEALQKVELPQLSREEALDVLSSRNPYNSLAGKIQEENELPIIARPAIAAGLKKRYPNPDDLKSKIIEGQAKCD